MIDYIKIQLINIDTDKLIQSHCFFRKVVCSTGEYIAKQVAEIHFCKITVYDSGRVEFSGSIHKMYNSINNILAPNYNENQYKGFNGNQFSINNIYTIIEYLKKVFDCKPNQMLIRSIEFGINTEPKFNPKTFINGLLFHKGIEFEFRFKRNFASVRHQQFILKVYNKSSLYNMEKKTLRIEIHYLKMNEVKGVGIETLADIDASTLGKIRNLILKRFSEIVYYDITIRENELSETQKRGINKYSNIHYWFNQLKPNRRHRPKKKLNLLIENHSENLHHQLKNELYEKCKIINQYIK